MGLRFGHCQVRSYPCIFAAGSRCVWVVLKGLEGSAITELEKFFTTSSCHREKPSVRFTGSERPEFMPQVFRKSANQWSRASLVGGVFLILGLGWLILMLQRADYVS